MNILNYFLIFTFFFIITTFGYIFSRRLLKENNLIYLIPLTICFGISFYVVLLHFFSLLFAVPKATYLTIFLIAIVSILIFFKCKVNESLTLGISKTQFALVATFSLFVGTLYLAYFLKFDTYDPGDYQIIGLMSKLDKYPNLNPFDPTISNIYHNGVCLLAASLKTFAKVETYESLFPIQTLFIATFPIILFSLIYSLTKSFSQAIFGSIIGIFCTSLRSISLLFFFLPENFNQITRNIREFLFWMSDSGFVNPIQKVLISPNSSIALPLSAFLLFVCFREKTNTKWNYLLIFTTSCFLFFAYEAYWVPPFIAILLYQFFLILKTRFNTKQISTSLFISLLLLSSPFTIGGVFQNKQENITKLVSVDIKPYTLSFGGTLQFVYPPKWFEKAENRYFSSVNGNIFYKVKLFSKYFFHEFGLPLVTLPIVIIWLLLLRNSRLLFLLASGFISLSLPLLITYNLIEIETHRFLIYSRFIFSLLFGTFLGYLLTIKIPVPFFKIVSSFVLILVVFITSLPGILWLLPKRIPLYEYRATVLTKADKAALSWLNKNSLPGDIGIGPWDIPFRCFELISTAGVYGSGVHIQNIAQEKTRLTALTTLDTCLLSELNIKWLYLNKNLDDFMTALIPQDITSLFDIVPKDKLNELIKSKVITKRYTYKDKSELRVIYEVNPLLTKNFCKEKKYIWALGRMQEGNFVPIKSSYIKTTFENKSAAIKYLRKFKKPLSHKDAIWYGVEAVKLKA